MFYFDFRPGLEPATIKRIWEKKNFKFPEGEGGSEVAQLLMLCQAMQASQMILPTMTCMLEVLRMEC